MTDNIHDDEFPDEHHHHPVPDPTTPLSFDVFITDDEGRHYLLTQRVKSVGVVIDIYDRYGEQCLASWSQTFDEIGELVFREASLSDDSDESIRTDLDFTREEQ